MGRQRRPPELKRGHRISGGTVWMLCEREGLLDPAHRSAIIWSICSPTERRRLARERQIFESTLIAGYTPPRLATKRRPAQPWLYVTTQRNQHYRVQPQQIERWKRVPPGPGMVGGWAWQWDSGRGNRWLQRVSAGMLRVHLRVEIEMRDAPAAAATSGEEWDDQPRYEQRTLF